MISKVTEDIWFPLGFLSWITPAGRSHQWDTWTALQRHPCGKELGLLPTDNGLVSEQTVLVAQSSLQSTTAQTDIFWGTAEPET